MLLGDQIDMLSRGKELVRETDQGYTTTSPLAPCSNWDLTQPATAALYTMKLQVHKRVKKKLKLFIVTAVQVT